MKRLHKRLAQLEAQLRYGATKLSKSQLFGIVQKILIIESAINTVVKFAQREVKMSEKFNEKVFEDIKAVAVLPRKYEELVLLVKKGVLTKKEATICYAGALRKHFDSLGRGIIPGLASSNYIKFSQPFGGKLRPIDFADDDEWIADAPNE